MKTLDYVLANYKAESYDGRDLLRILPFVTAEQAKQIGYEFKPEYASMHQPIAFTRENILEKLKSDLAFAFEKALDQRGLSAMAMYFTIKFYNWILEEGLEDWSDDNYAMYGLPLFKATALKYGFNNPIGDDEGNESNYGDE